MPIWKTISFSLLPAVLLFGLVELGLRSWYEPNRPFRFYEPHSMSVVQPDADLGYRLRPKFVGNAYASHVTTNPQGFRGTELHAKPGDRLIIALGDSCTFGFGASDDEHTYPAQLEELFRQSGEPVAVVNAGVVGYSSWQAYQFFKRDLVKLKPRTVLIYVGWNDMGNSILPDWSPTITQDMSRKSILQSIYIFQALLEVIARFRPPPSN